MSRAFHGLARAQDDTSDDPDDLERRREATD